MSRPCLILAAGFGTRMRHLTADRPKPLIEVAGETLLDRALDVAEGAGATKIAVNAHYRAAQIADHLAGRANVTCLIEQPEILDSGGAVKNAAQHWRGEPIFTLNADAVWQGPNPLTALEAAFDPSQMSALLLLLPHARAVGRQGGGDFRMDGSGRLTLDKSADTLVYLGAQILDPTPCLEDPRSAFSLHDAWAQFAKEGRLFGLVYGGAWADVGHPEGLADAEAMVEASRV